MCGIFGALIFDGFNSHIANRISHVMNELAVLNTVRGTHSTGIARIDNQNGIGKIYLYKNIIPAHTAVKTRKWTKVNVVNQNTTFILGHTRFATHGKISVNNAHPFVQDYTVGIHNGIISGILQKYPKLEVDSRAAIQLINDEGYNALSHYCGSAAIVTVNIKQPEVINFFRDGNPCHIFLNSRERFAVFSSQLDHLLIAMNLINLSEKDSKTMIFSLPECKQISFNTRTGVQIHEKRINLDMNYYMPTHGRYNYVSGEWNNWDDDDFYYRADEWDTNKTPAQVEPNSFTEENETQATIMDLAIDLKVSLNTIIANKKAFTMNYVEADALGEALNDDELFCTMCNQDKQNDSPITLYHINEFACFLCEDCLLTIQEALIKETEEKTEEKINNETEKIICEICEKDITAFAKRKSKLFNELEKKHNIPICIKCHKWMCEHDKVMKSV